MLFKQLVGPQVLQVANSTEPGRMLRVYAFCTKATYQTGAVTVVAININNATASFTVDVNGGAQYQRDEYHLTAPDGNMASNTVLLNGQALSTNSNGDLPDMAPVSVGSDTPVVLAPLSFGFFVFTNAHAQACI